MFIASKSGYNFDSKYYWKGGSFLDEQNGKRYDNLEINYPVTSRVGGPISITGGSIIATIPGFNEEFSLAGILWDLYDGIDGVDNDNIQLSLEQIWNVLNNDVARNNIYDIYIALSSSGIPVLSQDTNGNGVNNLDELFISRGIYDDLNGNGNYDIGEPVGLTTWPDRNGTTRPHRHSVPIYNGSYLFVTVLDSEFNIVPNVTLNLIETVGSPFEDMFSRYNHNYSVEINGLLRKIPFSMLPFNSTAVITVSSNGLESEPLILSSEFYWESLGRNEFIVNHTFILLPPPPTIPQVLLRSSQGFNKDNENLTAIIIGANNTKTNITDWRLNGASIALLNMPFDSRILAGSVKDYSTFSNNGTLGAGNADMTPSWISQGMVSGAYEFDGRDDYISFSNILDQGDNNFTIEVWVKPRSMQDELNIVRKGLSSAGTPADAGYGLRILDGRLHAQIQDASQGIQLSSDANSFVDTFIHTAMTVDRHNDVMKLFINGQEVNSSSIAGIGSIDVNLFFAIGANDRSPVSVVSSFWNGTIDEVRVYGRALSAEQIASNYAEGLAGRQPLNLTSQETSVGDRWKVCVTPNNQFLEGALVCSNELRVKRTLPTVRTNLTSINATNFTVKRFP